MRCLIMALVVGVCVMAMAGPAQAIKVTVINETNDGWYFTLHSQKYYGCVDYVTAHSTNSCSSSVGITVREVNVTRYDPTKFYWDCPKSVRCRFRSDPAIKESRVVVTIKKSGIHIKRKDGTVLESCP